MTYDELYQKYVVDDYSVKKLAEEYGFGSIKMTKILKENNLNVEIKKQYMIDNEVKLTSLQNDILIGSSLGDGALTKRANKTSLMVGHQEKQKEYCQLKLDLLSNIIITKEVKFSSRKMKKMIPMETDKINTIFILDTFRV